MNINYWLFIEESQLTELSQEERNRIVRALNERGANRPCPRCNNNSFSMVPGYFTHFIQQDTTNINLGGPSVPTVVVVCDRCGWLAEHALGVIGLMPPPASPAPGGNP